MKVLAAVLREPCADFLIEELDLEDPRADEVLVELAATGMCHTDLSCRDQTIPTQTPIVLGHEGAGVVVAVGGGVQDVAPGDHVLLTFGSCGACGPCSRHASAYCVDSYPLNLAGGRPDGSSAFDGGIQSHYFGQSAFATHAVVPLRNVVVVPRTAPLALLAPLGCGVQTGAGAVLNALRVPAGASLAVFGAGAVGLSAVMAARLIGADQVIAVDRVPGRLALARELGATHVIDARTNDPLPVIADITAGTPDFALEAAGSASTLHQALACLGRRGVCGLVGAAGPAVTPPFDWAHVLMNGITVRGIIQGDSTPRTFLPELVELFLAGRLPADKLITTYPFAEINRAVRDTHDGTTVKPVLLMPDQGVLCV